MKKETTIYDIAKELNVSAATVSRALNNHPGISAKVKTLIQSKATDLGYRSNKLQQTCVKRERIRLVLLSPA